MFKLKTARLFFFLFPFLCVLRLMADDGEGGGRTPSASDPSVANSAAAPVDAEAIKLSAKTEAAAEFAAKLKTATGFDSLESLTAEKLKADGKLQELADTHASQAQTWQTKYKQSAVQSALLSAAAEAVDPSVVAQLLAGQCQCDDDGNVTIGGKPVADAVKTLLTDKPYLAKAQGGTGSGAGTASASAGKTLTRGELDRMDSGARAKFFADGGKLTD